MRSSSLLSEEKQWRGDRVRLKNHQEAHQEEEEDHLLEECLKEEDLLQEVWADQVDKEAHQEEVEDHLQGIPEDPQEEEEECHQEEDQADPQVDLQVVDQAAPQATFSKAELTHLVEIEQIELCSKKY
jgi:hypothetical protein